MRARDLRTPGQRRHDALLTGLKLLLASGRLPKAGGCATTVLLTMDVDDFATEQRCRHHRARLPDPGRARRNAGWTRKPKPSWCCCPRPAAILAYSDKQRLFTEQQRLAMLARDGGCSYPGCDATLAWLDAHHITDWQHTHRTSVDDGALVCGPHHDTFQNHGLDLHHARRPTPLDPTPLARPRPRPQTQPPARPE